MKNYALCIAYEGSLFLGWQKTSRGPSIEETLQLTLERILQTPISLQAASRTDKGVHAKEQWVNFQCQAPLMPGMLRHNLNCLLPTSIRVLSVHEMPAMFHPTVHALAKEYHYHISLGPIQMPYERHFSWHVPYPLNLEKMKEASLHFLGTHDFSSFCNLHPHLNYKDKTRHLTDISLSSQEQQLLICITGNQFLYKMVRNLVGTLVYVGRGKIEPGAIPQILAARQRTAAGITAPAHGLFLNKIYYPQEFMISL